MVGKLHFLAVFAVLASTSAASVEQAFKDAKIVPDEIPVAPKERLGVEFHATNKAAELGNELKPVQVRQIPEIIYEADDKSFYTLVMADPDAPTPEEPTVKSFLHWSVGNIPGKKIHEGQIIAEYVGSGPPKGSNPHRYVFVVYKQPGKVEFKETYRKNTDGNRGHFSFKSFAEKYKLGNPIAGNYYKAQYDCSVPALHKQLGF